MTQKIAWYVRRLRRMGVTEVSVRVRDHARQRAWSHQQVRPGTRAGAVPGLRTARVGPVPLPSGAQESIPTEVRSAIIDAADRLALSGWTLFGVPRPDILNPDWFLDPASGVRAPQEDLAFRIDHRDPAVTGNIKSVWELSRHHHLTVLAAAYCLSENEVYAEIVDAQLRRWWAENPFLSGVHWTSGIELGVRLVSWAWIRRLLDGWPKVGDLFETNDDAVHQIWWHQRYLAAFPSHGSSANNHAVAEQAGRLVAASAFPWYAETDGWRRDAAARLSRHFLANTYPSGVNRELATDYHRFVTELVSVAAVEAAVTGEDLSPAVWARLAASYDAAAAMLDETGAPPRQGDGDEGRALVIDDPDHAHWLGLLDWGRAIVGPCEWWPEPRRTVVGALLGSLLGRPRPTPGRPAPRPRQFSDAGVTLLTTDPGDGTQMWCRCDAGPLGFLSIAAHGHADALSVELRCDGVEVLVDPGTYCYHGEPEWRRYFRSTRAHNTVEIDGQDQAVQGGPFLWSTDVPASVLASEVSSGRVRSWTASHGGYSRLPGAPVHERTVALDQGLLRIVDRIQGGGTHTVRLFFHLGPAVSVGLRGANASLLLPQPAAKGARRLTLHLPDSLAWTAVRGQTEPIGGWYSPRFGVREPITTLVGVASTPLPDLVTSLVVESP